MSQPTASWVPCGCGDFWCKIHDSHAHDCACPPIEDWGPSPYGEAGAQLLQSVTQARAAQLGT
jgi:hypothetical protein